ncbi:F-box protein [Raphanus sativus]|uniref:F-box protein At1g49990 n=1 Tax=Raphanus sativus TaxID=3726 RepID=A0A9W3C5D4_RAPSA|nr:F-box protein At1g49990 [Raphanus sativus]KAJ4917621.1 F-box protein [Raphanus sativus]
MVRTSHKFTEPIERKYEWGVYVYSSETGTWTFKRLRSPFPLQHSGFYRPLNFNGMLYMWEKRLDDPTGPGVLVSYDFYAQDDDDECGVIPLPVPDIKYPSPRRCLTTSCEDVIYVEVLCRRLKVWKLKSNDSNGEWWQLTREEIDMVSVGFDVDCFPLGMNPFDIDFVYLWSRQHGCLVSGNLRTLEFTLHQETETWSDGEGCWRVNKYDSKKYMDPSTRGTGVLTLSQFVLPQWMDPVPRPPN